MYQQQNKYPYNTKIYGGKGVRNPPTPQINVFRETRVRVCNGGNSRVGFKKAYFNFKVMIFGRPLIKYTMHCLYQSLCQINGFTGLVEAILFVGANLFGIFRLYYFFPQLF